MKRVLQGVGVVIGLVALILWIAGGRNLGWTRTQKQVKTLDEVTGIEGIEWQREFSPGVDFLALAAASGAAAWGAALLWKSK